MLKLWTDHVWDDYMYWHDQNDKRNIKQINKLIKDIERSPFAGLGKPRALKYKVEGYWSRRITQEHRLIYKIDKNTIIIFSCRSHYE